MATVLIVDDERAIVDLLCELAIDAGHLPVAAYNGREALSLAHHHHPALIISDVMMPVMDGYALLQALQTTPALAHILVILISATANVTQIPRNVAAFIAKPLDLALLDGFLQALP
jgi:CheY-like chemotaxis protein